MSLDHEGGLGADARLIIDAARAAEDPSGDDVARVRGKIFAHLGLAAAGGAAALATTAAAEGSVAATVGVGTQAAVGTAATTSVVGAATTTAATTTVATTTAATTTVAATTGAASTVAAASGASFGLLGKMTMATKIGLAVLALGGAGTGIVATTRSPAEPPPAVAAAPASPAEPASTSPPMAQPPAISAPSLPSAGVDDPSAPDLVAPTAATAATAPARRLASPGAAASADVDPLAEEAALLGRAQSALAAGRHDEALGVLDEHARRFPSGVLAHEREAARWLALCGSGRREAARGPVTAFLAEHPSSPLAARLRAACGLP